MKKTRIISAFPASGKTYLFENGYEDNIILDSDVNIFLWLENSVTRNPEFPNNYIDHIKYNIGKADYIFVSSHIDVRKALDDNDLCWSLVIPEKTLLNEWIGRCYQRGSDNKFIDTMINNWDNWTYSDWNNNAVAICKLQSGEYLSDKMFFLETTIYN